MDYQERLQSYVTGWLEAEQSVERTETFKRKTVADLNNTIAKDKATAEQYRGMIEKLLKQDGVMADDVDIGAFKNIRVAMQKYQPPLEVVGIEAVPDDFIRIKKEINKEKINATYRNAESLPNWLTRPDATYKLVKREVKKVSEDAKDVG